MPDRPVEPDEPVGPEAWAVRWPARQVSFSEGDAIDRFGVPDGFYASPKGTPFAERSLPPTVILPHGGRSAYHAYLVTAKWETDPPPVTVLQDKAFPWFGQPGGGVQYRFLGESIGWLVLHGYLREVTT